MNRRIVRILLLIISVGLFFAAAYVLIPSTDYRSSLVSNEEYETIKNERTESETDVIKSIEFNGNPIYQASNTWYYSIIEEARNSYNPNITIDHRFKIAFRDDEILNDKDIADSKAIDFIVYDNSKYSQYRLAVTTLPIIHIDHNDEIPYREDVNMTFSLFDNRKNIINRVIKSRGKIHVRGGLNAGNPKVSYRINLRELSLGRNERNNNLSLLGMRKDDDWILYAPYSDCEKIRNVLNSQLWRETSTNNGYTANPTGTDNRFVEVINNGVYSGIYALSTTIDEKALGLQKDEATGNYSSYIYKNENYHPIPGYTIDDNRYTLKTNKVDDEKATWNTLLEYNQNVKENFNYDYAISHLNLDSLIDYILFSNFTNNVDTLTGRATKNLFLLFKQKDEDYEIVYIPWDFDMTWGGSSAWDKNYKMDYNYDLKNEGTELDLLVKNNPSLKQRVLDRYAALRKTIWSNEHINSLIDNYEKDIYGSGAYEREKERWPQGAYIDSGLKYFREYVKQRIEYIDYKIGYSSKKPNYETPLIK